MPNSDANASSMPPELEVALISLEKAQQDLVAAQKLLHDADISDEIVGFHIQQAIEKSFKAILLRHTIDYPHTHNLRLLIDLCRNNHIQIPSFYRWMSSTVSPFNGDMIYSPLQTKTPLIVKQPTIWPNKFGIGPMS